jgi:pSer/pThr/pTyr-binding forkhead associated (FHA) protein
VARLIIYEELEEAETIYETFDLSVNRILIGSDEDNHLILVSPEIDPMHASLELRDDHWILQDLGGPGGTAVNGGLIEGPFRLKHNDLIELGQIKMKFDDGSEVVEEEPEEAVELRQPRRSREENPSGRVWFAKVALATIMVILVILGILAAAHYLGLIVITDLVPPWLLGES